MLFWIGKNYGVLRNGQDFDKAIPQPAQLVLLFKPKISKSKATTTVGLIIETEGPN